MPPVDLENLASACAGGVCCDSKVTCETLAGDSDDDNAVVAAADPDLPPESFWLSKDAEYDWFEHHTFFERKDSGGRGGSSLTADAQSNSSSQRFSFSRKSKAAILGLPKTQKTTFVDPKRRPCNKPVTVRLFPKRPEPPGKSAVPVEPGSPKVSCIGRVRSKRGRRLSGSLRRREKAAEKLRSGGGEKAEKEGKKKQKAGFYTKMMGMFRSKRSRSKKAPRSGSRRAADEMKAGAELQRWSASSRVREMAGGGEAPGLGGLNRFASGRRSASSWAAEDLSETVSGSDRHVGVVGWS
ncbi:hypothetical protein SASPL_124845 [Salvia splendens]|uniref:Uncharacterized protein n=1 Tax=Salvia splendens TaxID=180675 RepID=A0A8X8XHF2_SALSN|nr:uncharacterized protein LOC121748098 [Salvia splendens]KAG6412175.1 hypothetical protein SASPL_124845 [Salvia splendens]